jgi:glycosyltransferase involved in cell wall biosynthesis
VDATNQNTGPNADQNSDLELSVIIPARNEEQSLPACLESLIIQSEPGFFGLGEQWEIIIVNDDSTDRTREIATSFAAKYPGIVVLDAPPLDLSDRGGFTGKNNACWAAAQVARGRRLLFTDADTIHQHHNLSHSIHEMEKHKAALLSYSPRQIVTGFWQHAVMPLVFSELASVYPTREVNDSNNRLAAANGQFILVDRDAYFSVGGHRAIGTKVLEDVALAHNIKRGPRVIRFRYAPEAISTRMYRSNAEMVEGWTKNLALLFPKPIALALWRILDILLFLGLPALALGLPWLVTWQRYALLVVWIRTLYRFYSRAARSNFPAIDIAISILGIPMFVYLLIRSVIHHRVKKSVAWKGRSYNASR